MAEDLMLAVVIVGDGRGRRLAVEEIPVPRIEPGEVLVRVRAAGLNRADLALNPGHRPADVGRAHAVAGLEFAGEIAEVGAAASGARIGDRVMGWAAGAQAEFCKTDARLLLPVPDGMTFEAAAALPVALMTMHDAVVTHGRLKPGESVLVQGASAGVGLMALAVAKARDAGLVIAGSRSRARLDRLAAFGMDRGVVTAGADWATEVLEATDGRGVDLLIDLVAGPTMNGNLRATAVRGRIVNVGRLGGMTGDFDFDLHAFRRIDYIGVTFRTRSVEEIAEIVRRTHVDLFDDVAAGRLRLPVDRTYPIDEAAAAHDYMRSNDHLGKIVLLV